MNKVLSTISTTDFLPLQTRVLVTHGVTYLPKVDEIIVLKNNRISEVGTFDELIRKEGPFADFIRTYLNESDESGDASGEGKIRR